MGNCRKCGAKKIKRRAAGVFDCRHCGYQPGPMNLDRSGIPTEIVATDTETEPTALDTAGTAP